MTHISYSELGRCIVRNAWGRNGDPNAIIKDAKRDAETVFLLAGILDELQAISKRLRLLDPDLRRVILDNRKLEKAKLTKLEAEREAGLRKSQRRAEWFLPVATQRIQAVPIALELKLKLIQAVTRFTDDYKSDWYGDRFFEHAVYALKGPPQFWKVREFHGIGKVFQQKWIAAINGEVPENSVDAPR